MNEQKDRRIHTGLVTAGEVAGWIVALRRVRASRVRRLVAACVSAVLAVTMVGQAASYGKPWAGEWRPPAPQQVAGVKVTPLPTGSAPAPGSRDKVAGKPAKVAWPAAGKVRVSLPASASSAATAAAGRQPQLSKADGLPVRIGAPQTSESKASKALAGAATSAAAPAAARVQVGDRQAAAAAGVHGLLLAVANDDTTRSSGVESAVTDTAVTVEIDYSGFADAYGGDWAARLQLALLPGCSMADKTVHGRCAMPIPLASVNDTDAKTVTATVPLSGRQATTMAVMAGPAGGNGDYTATSLSPAGTWQVSAQTGGFTWSQPLRVVPGVNGPAPSLSLGYSSQAMDGRTSNTNTQGSWVGDGWDMWPGYIERRYQTCLSDMDPVDGQTPNNPYDTADLCWLSDNATISLHGRATELVKAADGTWKGVADDGSRIERLTDTNLGNGDTDGEYWKVTSTDGTQYFFGRNRRDGYPTDTAATNSTWLAPVYGNHPGEPGYVAGNFPGSRQTQAWRWNLDYVIDVHGNTMTLFYGKEEGAYAREADPDLRTTYDRGGYLIRIDYGTRKGTEHTATVPARVVFDVADRCLPDSVCAPDQPASWADTPWDQYCAAAPCTQGSPTFWTQKRLAKIRTQVWRTGGFSDVESWTLRHDYLDAGAADGEGVPMWLAGITHSGHVTTAGGTEVSDPEIVFDPGSAPLANRVDGPDDGRTKLNRFRIHRIWTESGSIITVNYAPTECTGAALPQPHTNTKRCYPQWYGPLGQEPTLDWFHKYVVDYVIVDDNTGASARMETHYDYLDDPAWHYDDSELVEPDKRTWSQWRGYGKVQVRKGEEGSPQSAVEYLYLRGMDGDRATPEGGNKTVSVTDSQGTSITDHEAHAGFVRETITYNGVGGAVVTGSIHEPWLHGPIADSGTLQAWRTNIATSRTRTVLEGGGVRWTKTTTSFDPTYGLPTQVDDLGDESISEDDQCTRMTYVRNTDLWMVGKVSRTETVKVKCSVAPIRPDHVLSDSRVYFDDPETFGATPTRGLPRRTEQLDSWNDTTPVYVTTSRSNYDAHGRIVEATDALGRVTKSRFTPELGGPVTEASVINALEHVNTSYVEPAWGHSVKTVNANGHVAELTYDGLGRLTQVWTPGRDKATQSPSLTFDYLLRNNAPSAVTTRSLLTHGENYLTSVSLLDGGLRPRQTQTQAPGGGRTVSDTIYDSQGRLAWQSKPYWDSTGAAPNTTLVGPAGQEVIPGLIEYRYDGAGRTTAEIFKAQGVEKWRTSISHGGDRVHVTPPAGATATTTISDARGRTTHLRQYHGPSPTGTYDQTQYGYGPRGELTSVLDPAGNTWTWEYDQRGRRKNAIDPDTGTSTYTYDTAGQVQTVTDGRDITIGFTYDVLGRKTSMRDGSPTGPLRAEWIYDTLPNGIGQLSRSIRHDNGNQYINEVAGYDNAGRPTGSRVIIPSSETGLAGTYQTGLTYTQNGALARLDLPAIGDLASEDLVHSYNDVGQQDEINARVIMVYSSTFNKLGELTQRVLGYYGRRIPINYAIDEPTGRITNVSVSPEGQNEAADWAYRYDPAGNLTRIADSPGSTLPNDTQCFRYDHLRRLINAWTPSSKTDTNCDPNPQYLGGAAKYRQDFQYDAVGNRTKLTEYTSSTPASTTTYTHPNPGGIRPHSLTSATTVTGGVTTLDTYEYDAAGNTTKRVVGGTTQTLTWDSEGRIQKTTDPGGDTTYLYDADGNRLIRRDAGGKTLYLPSQELHYTNGQTTATRYYTHLGTQIAVRTSAGLTWTVTDHHNTAEIAIRDTDLQVQRRRTKPFGDTRGAQPVWWAGDKGFLGGTEDPNGLTHLGARLYDPKLGRFVSIDPIMNAADPQQMHGYAYANNNPVSFSDPSGLYYTEDSDDTGSRGYPTDDEIIIVGKWDPPTIEDVTFSNDPDAVTVAEVISEGCARSDINCVQFGIPGEWWYQGRFVDLNETQQQRVLFETFCRNNKEECAQIKAQIEAASIQLMLDIIGVTDAINCTQGSIGGCAWTIVNFFPGTKITKIAKTRKLKKGDEVLDACPNSFMPGTGVLLADGTTKSIEDLQVGDVVLATDPETGETAAKTIAATITGTGSKNLVEITIAFEAADGTNADTVIATAGHPFWVPSLSEWITASKLETGSWLQTSAGTYVQITAIKRWTQWTTVYNLTVTDLHTYYVLAGQTPVLVHNSGGDRFDYLSRPGYSNYVLVDSSGKVYYSGMFGPGDTAAGVQYRHANNHNRFNPANGDTMRVMPGTRTYGESRLMEQRLAEQHGTIIGRDGANYRGNRQNPLAGDKLFEYGSFEARLNGGC